MVPVTAETARQETVEDPVVTPPDETASAVTGNEVPQAAGAGGQADAGDAPVQAESPTQVTVVLAADPREAGSSCGCGQIIADR